LCKPRLSSSIKTCEVSPKFLQFYSVSVLRLKNLKKLTQVLSYVFCIQVRRHVHEKNHKKEIKGRKVRTFFFPENHFCSLSVWNLLRLFPWIFWIEIFTRYSPLCLLSFGCDLSSKSVPQDSQENFYSSLSVLKGRFVCVWKCLLFFSCLNTHPFDLKFDALCPKFSRHSYVEFREKTILGEFFRNFVQTKAILYQNLWIFTLIFAILFWVRIVLKNTQKIDTSSFICCLYPSKETRPWKNHKK